MSDADNHDGRSSVPWNQEGVLANLPRTRPQRSSPRRAAARNTTAAPGRTETVNGGTGPRGGGTAAVGRSRKPITAKVPAGKRTKTTAKRSGTSPKRPSTSAKRPRTYVPGRAAGPAHGAAPRQGFECDSDATGGSVQPPGGAELVASAAEIVGELAKAGLSTGERLLKDVLSRLPLS